MRNGQRVESASVPPPQAVSDVSDVSDDPLFGPRSVTWRVHADPVFPIAGVRALILQALHPLTMAAVAQHRGFDEDFWGRLDRTGRYVSTLTYGPGAHARRAEIRALRAALLTLPDRWTGPPEVLAARSEMGRLRSWTAGSDDRVARARLVARGCANKRGRWARPTRWKPR